MLKELTKAVVERCLETELDTHLGALRVDKEDLASVSAHRSHSLVQHNCSLAQHAVKMGELAGPCAGYLGHPFGK